MKLSEVLAGVLFSVIVLGGMGLFIYSGMQEAQGLLNHCKENGYDGVRYEEVNFIKDELKCANFTVEDEYHIEKNRKFNEAGQDVWDAFTGKSAENSGGIK